MEPEFRPLVKNGEEIEGKRGMRYIPHGVWGEEGLWGRSDVKWKLEFSINTWERFEFIFIYFSIWM